MLVVDFIFAVAPAGGRANFSFRGEKVRLDITRTIDPT